MTMFRSWKSIHKEQDEGHKSQAQVLFDHAVAMNERAERILKEQQEVSAGLREELRKNHFAQLFQYGVPVRNDHDKEG